MTGIAGYATPEGTSKFARDSSALDANYKKFLGLLLSNVGVGTYLGEPDDHTDTLITDAIVQSVNSGINVIDTAINYRAQKSERAVGKAIAKLVNGDDEAKAEKNISRDQLFVCTKGGYVTNDAESSLGFWEYVRKEYTDTGVIKADDITSAYHCMTPAYLSDQIDRSIKNTGLECIDLVYLHNAVEGQVKDVSRDKFMQNMRDVMAMYEKRREDGSIRYYGMATWECFRVDDANSQHLSLEEVMNMAADVGGQDHGFRFIQIPFNLYYDQALLSKYQTMGGDAMSALEAASRLEIGVFTSVPFMQGRLLQPGTMPEFSDMTPPLRALQLIRSAPGVLAPLVGQKTSEHVQENMKIMKTAPIPEEEFPSLVKSLVSHSSSSSSTSTSTSSTSTSS